MDFDRIDPGKRGGYYTPENVRTRFIREIKVQKARAIAEDPAVPRG